MAAPRAHPPADDAPDRAWMKPTELAAKEHVSRATVWNWATKGIVEVRRHAPKTGVRMRVRE
jgi:hypothetical protein